MVCDSIGERIENLVTQGALPIGNSQGIGGPRDLPLKKMVQASVLVKQRGNMGLVKFNKQQLAFNSTEQGKYINRRGGSLENALYQHRKIASNALDFLRGQEVSIVMEFYIESTCVLNNK